MIVMDTSLEGHIFLYAFEHSLLNIVAFGGRAGVILSVCLPHLT
jgi:hypothetical protein